MSAERIRRIPASFHEKVWGVTDLAPWYPDVRGRIGEVWFEADLPLLVKFVLTSERLSVQVHPGDAFAAAHENSLGKTEMWHVLRAEPGAQVAIGLREPVSLEQLRADALSGEIEKRLCWFDASVGDTFFIPAGTIHAIGAGVVLCEVQQHSNVTYRLYDYGRDRELHVEKALAVAVREPSDAGRVSLPVSCPYFYTGILESGTCHPGTDHFQLLIVLEGTGSIGRNETRAGETWLVPPGSAPFEIGAPLKILRTQIP
ncbi:MAG: class I mannose-6-phosphate isomerase [Acidobacteriota bacterium]|nr:class I mannose-6-phosphate isomerase [Acidobacteriota bacterium]